MFMTMHRRQDHNRTDPPRPAMVAMLPPELRRPLADAPMPTLRALVRALNVGSADDDMLDLDPEAVEKRGSLLAALPRELKTAEIVSLPVHALEALVSFLKKAGALEQLSKAKPAAWTPAQALAALPGLHRRVAELQAAYAKPAAPAPQRHLSRRASEGMARRMGTSVPERRTSRHDARTGVTTYGAVAPLPPEDRHAELARKAAMSRRMSLPRKRYHVTEPTGLRRFGVLLTEAEVRLAEFEGDTLTLSNGGRR